MTKYTIDGVTESSVPVPAAMGDGTEVPARLRVIVVELSTKDIGGRISYYEPIPTDAEKEAALAKYARGAVMDVTLTIVPEPPPAP